MRGLSAAALCAVAGSLMLPVVADPGDPPLDGQILMIYPGNRVAFSDATWAAQDKLLSASPYYQAARSLGYTVSNVTTEEWSELTEEDFQVFKAIFISKLGTGTTSDYSFLDTTKAAWGAAVKNTGNVMLSGAPVSDIAAQEEVTDVNDPDAVTKNNARLNARIVLKNAINFIAKGSTTGLYIEVPMTTDAGTTGDMQTNGETLSFLSGLGDFKLRIFGDAPPTGVTSANQDVVTLVARHPDIPNLESSTLSPWDRSARSVFSQRGTGFEPLSIASAVTGLEAFQWTDSTGTTQTGPAVIVARSATALQAIPETCGDSTFDPLVEQCDPSGTSDPNCNQATCLCTWGYDSVTSTCVQGPTCGDSAVDYQRGEECDLGSANGDGESACTADCRCRFGGYTDSEGDWKCVEECGNGVLTGPEECDDGVLLNGQTGSSCSDTCTCKYGTEDVNGMTVCLTSLCGDGEVTGNEQCDDDDNGQTGSVCTNTCTCKYGTEDVNGAIICKISDCGDAEITGNEECDDALNNGAADSLCSETCTCKYGLAMDPAAGPCASEPAPSCGNNLIEPGEQCDNDEDELCNNCQCLYGPAENPTALVPCAAAPAATCGNNVRETGEECDNDEDELCNDICECLYGPAEDPTDQVPCAAAPAATCGNNVVETGEQCDNENDDLCNDTCECIYGPAADPTADVPCATAPAATCGNNVVEAGEQCDNEDDDLCNDTCECIYGPAPNPTTDAPCATAPPSCGNDIIESGEECDDGSDLCNEECECVFGLNEETGECYETAPAITTTASVTEAATTTESASVTGDATMTEGNTVTEDVTTTESADATATEDASATESAGATVTGDVTAIDSATATKSAVATATEDVSLTESAGSTATEDVSVTESAGSTATEDVSATESADATVTESAGATVTSDVTATESATVTSTGNVTVTESAAATATEDVTMTGSRSATDVVTVTESNTMTSATDATQTGTNTAGTQTTTSPSSPSSTDGPLPQELQSEDGASFSFVGCAASSENYRGFTLEQESDDMDLNVCVTVCKDRLYSGAYKNQCYCGDELDDSDVSVVGEAACDLTCPGNPSQNCGGDLDTTEKLRVRQVTAGILLSLYKRDIVDGSSPSLAPTVTGTGTLSAPLPSQTAGGVTINNINNIDIDINIILVPFAGVDCLGQLVYIKSCDICKAGEMVSWAPKRCANADDCAGMKVYKPEQCSDNNGRCNPGTSDYDFVVEKPCTTCDGGVIYQPKGQDNAAPQSPEHQAQPQPQQPGAGDVPGQLAGDNIPVTAGSGRFSAFQSLVAGLAVNIVLAGLFLSGGVMVARLTTTRQIFGNQ
ncbi:hypothetical protein PpBr36_00275 [Pyricularia pennisetigena]|uniref:hypothetical protein n=1 Tax=Pyricularia pennisetigena TaxID=1578925 RepID=UPI001154B7FE|nr:hypothetical protein PpBr36_00275 [Pyricularia pennisetigena]TLS29655.1 hypothetical protein PpBr36_00275 [Pyricularia pennisetigena]